MPSQALPHDHDHDHRHHEHHAEHKARHGHDHHQAPKDFGSAFAWGIGLNCAFILAEVIFGLKANALSLLADAGHNLSDVLGLFLAWGATWLAKRGPTARLTFGLSSASILAAMANIVFLLVALGGVGWEAVQRLIHPAPSGGLTVIVVAGLGIIINGVTALIFMKGADHDLNLKGAFLHMASDAAVSAGIVLAGGVILMTGWTWLDPVVSLGVVILILWGTWGLLKDALTLSLQGVPPGIAPERILNFLRSQPGVAEVHDLHIWGLSTTQTAMSAHLVMPEGHPGDAWLQRICADLKTDHAIHHATIQIELADSGQPCAHIHG